MERSDRIQAEPSQKERRRHVPADYGVDTDVHLRNGEVSVEHPGRVEVGGELETWAIVDQQADHPLQHGEIRKRSDVDAVVRGVRVSIDGALVPALELDDGRIIAINSFQADEFPKFTANGIDKKNPTVYLNPTAQAKASKLSRRIVDQWFDLTLGGSEV